MTASSTGNRHMHWTDWTPFIQWYFKPVPNIITSYHHFKFSKVNAGVVTVKVYATSEEEDVNIVSSFRGHRPDAIVPTGLDPVHCCEAHTQRCPKPSHPTGNAQQFLKNHNPAA